MKKRLLTLVISAVLGTVMMVTSAFAQYEGTGFNTAQDAAKAYMEAFAANDVEGIISTCAVESYVENYDLAAMIERMRAWMMTMQQPIPATNPYAKDLMVQKRVSEISNWLMYQYLIYSMRAEDGTMLGDIGAPIQISGDEGSAETFIAETFMDPVWVRDTIGKVSVTTPEQLKMLGIELNANYFSEKNQENMQKNNERYGVEDYQELICLFPVKNGFGIQFLGTGKYNGKWYVLTTMPNISIILGMSTYTGGLAIADATNMADAFNMFF